MERDVQQAREMGELTATVKATNSILERMENKLDNAIDTVTNHTNTISLLTKVSSENSGAIVQIQETMYGRDKQSGMTKDVDELKKFKCAREKFDEENRVGAKKILFSISEKIALIVIGAVFAGGFFKKIFEHLVK